MRVPNLDLRRPAQIKPRIARDGKEPPVGPQFEIAVVTRCRERIAALEAVEEERTVANVPMRVTEGVGLFLHRVAFFRRRAVADDGIVEATLGRHALPKRPQLRFVTREIRREAARRFHDGLGTNAAQPRTLGEAQDADVLELDALARAQQADAPFRQTKAGMGLAVERVAIATERAEVGLGDESAVEDDLDLLARHADLDEVPEARPTHVAAAAREVPILAADLAVHVVALGRREAERRARIAVGAVEPVNVLRAVIERRAAVVEKLDLAHRLVGRVHGGGRHPHANAAVAIFGEPHLETQDEISERLACDEVLARTRDVLREGDDVFLLHRPVGEARFNRLNLEEGRAFPRGQVRAVEEAHESLVNRVGVGRFLKAGGATHGGEREKGEKSLHVIPFTLKKPSIRARDRRIPPNV